MKVTSSNHASDRRGAVVSGAAALLVCALVLVPALSRAHDPISATRGAAFSFGKHIELPHDRIAACPGQIVVMPVEAASTEPVAPAATDLTSPGPAWVLTPLRAPPPC